MDSKCLKISLTKLYKNQHIRNLIWDVLKEDFEDAFERLIKELRLLESPLIDNAKKYKDFIKDMYIEYGHPMETTMDLKKIMDQVPISWELNECE